MICPFLGMPGDTKTALAFPSVWNSCHRCKPAAVVALTHQKNCCLAANYEACPAFLQTPNDALPRGLRHKRPANRNIFWKVLFSILALLAMMFILGKNLLVQGAPISTLLSSETSSPVSPSVSVLPTATITPSSEQLFAPAGLITSTPSLLPISNPTSSRSRVTPIVTRKPHDIEQWIGVNYIFLIYRVKQGWSIERLAAQYNTTAVAVAAVNYKLSVPLHPGQLVIIPINQMDVSGLPQFEPYQVAENIIVEELAARLNADPEQLRYFNGFGTNEQLMAKEWIIVPRERTK